MKFRLRFGVEASEKENGGSKFKLFFGVEASKKEKAGTEYKLFFGLEAKKKEKAGTKFKLFFGVEPKWLCRPHHRPLSSRAAITFSSYYPFIYFSSKVVG